MPRTSLGPFAISRPVDEHTFVLTQLRDGTGRRPEDAAGRHANGVQQLVGVRQTEGGGEIGGGRSQLRHEVTLRGSHR